MRLLDVNEKGEIKADPYILTIEVFKKIWDRNEDKEKSAKELAYVFYMENKTNEFNFWHIDDRVERSNEIIKYLFGKDSKWKADQDMQNCIDFYREKTQTFTAGYFEDAVIGANKSRQYFREIDWEEKDKSGKHIFDIKKLNEHLEKSFSITESIANLQKKVIEEEQKSSSRRAGKQKGMYEDGG